MSKEIELTRRKVLGSAAVVGAASAGAGAGTFAYFSDQETSNNTITAGQVELNDPTTAGFDLTDIAPGNSYSPSVSVDEPNGNLSDGDVEFDIKVEITGDAALADYLYATVKWDGTELGSGTSLSDYAGTYTNVTLPGTSGADLSFDIDFNPDDGANGTTDSNVVENDSVNVDVTFLLRQSGASTL